MCPETLVKNTSFQHISVYPTQQSHRHAISPPRHRHQHRVCYVTLYNFAKIGVDFPVLTHRGIDPTLAKHENFAKKQPTQLEVQQVADREAEGQTEGEEESQIRAA
jgi:hypothetical protein